MIGIRKLLYQGDGWQKWYYRLVLEEELETYLSDGWELVE